MQVLSKIWRFFWKSLLVLAAILVLLFAMVWAVLKFPPLQNYLVTKATTFVSKKTNTTVSLGAINIAFPKAIVLERLFLNDKKNDTLLALESLEIDVNMLALMQHNIKVNHIDLHGLNANINRADTSKNFNFQFLIDAFASADTTSKPVEVKKQSDPWKIDFETLNIYDSKAQFLDGFGGTFVKTNIRELSLEVDRLDLAKKTVSVSKIFIDETTFDFLKTKTSIDTNSTVSPAPWVAAMVGNIRLRKIKCNYADSTSAIYFNTAVQKLDLEDAGINLITQKIRCQSLALVGSESVFKLISKLDKSNQKVTQKQLPTKPANTASWSIVLATMKLSENNFEMHTSNNAIQAEGIDWKHLKLEKLAANIHSIKYAKDTVEAELEHLGFQEQSGFGLRKFYGNFSMYKQRASLSNFLIETNFSKLAHHLAINYDSLSAIANPRLLEVNLKSSSIAIKDLLLLQPNLKKVDIINQNRNRTFIMDVEAKGTLESMLVRKLLVQTNSKQTRIFATAKLKNLNKPENIAWNAVIHQISSNEAELSSVLPASILPKSIKIPRNFTVKGTSQGNTSNINADIMLVSSSGNIDVKGDIAQLKSKSPTYTAAVNINQLHLGEILKNDSLFGNLTMEAQINGKGFDMKTADAEIKTKIDLLEMKKYAYKHINADVQVNDGKASLKMDVKDTNLRLALEATYNLLKNEEHIIAKLDLKGADIQALKLTNENIRLSGVVTVDMKGITMPTLNGQLAIKNILILKDKKSYAVDSLMFISVNAAHKSSLKVNTSLLSARFDGQIDVTAIAAVATQHINRYFNIAPQATISQNKLQDFDFEIMVNDSPLLYDLLLPKLKNYTPAPIKGGFDSKNEKLWLQTNISRLEYDNLDIKKFQLSIDSDSAKMAYNLGFETFSMGEYKLDNTKISGTIAHNSINTNWLVVDENKKERLRMASELVLTKSNVYRFKILEQGIILDGNQWLAHPANYIEFGTKKLFVNQFNLTKINEKISAQSSSNGNDIDVLFEKFNLKNISQIVERNDSLARGILEGNIKLKNVQGQSAFIADLTIKNVSFKKSYVGDLSLKADNLSKDRYTILAHLGGLGNDATVSGFIQNAAEGQQLRLNTTIEKIQVSSIVPFTGAQISNGKGIIKGKVAIIGTTKTPLISGNIDFIEASMNVAYINSNLSFKNESIKFDPKGIYFDDFTMRDTLGNTAVMDGKILMKEFGDFKFALSLETNNFLALNTTEVNNKLYYGKIILDSKVKISGTPALPVIKADVALVRGSTFTFAIPESKLSTDKGEGVVEFVNDNSSLDSIMTRVEKDTLVSTYRGLDISTNFRIDKFSTLKILIDPIAGDSLVVKGDASLNFSLDPSGKTSLTGTYALTDGSYKVTLQDLITKDFKILPGSTITWVGDPLDAQIDITAQYTTRTTAADLMGGSKSGADSAAFSVPIDFYVMLIMKGQLLKPELSFKIDMPLGSRNIAGGAVYSKLTTLNNTPSELNKQVFSLLLLNRFIPNSGGSGSGGASSIARSSISKMMSEELNKLSAQHIKGVELNFDLQSFNSNAANGKQQGNTQLKVGVKKQLFDERLSVQVGSNVNLEGNTSKQSNMSNLTGDVVIEYKLSKDGRYRLKGFRQNQYDGIANGVITQTGVGIMYRRDFETMKELLSAPKKIKVKEKKSKEKKSNANP